MDNKGVEMNYEVTKAQKTDNWIMVNLPDNCPSISISFKREIAEMQVERFGATPLYGLDGHRAEQLPVEIFITCGGILAPDQRRQEVQTILP